MAKYRPKRMFELVLADDPSRLDSRRFPIPAPLTIRLRCAIKALGRAFGLRVVSVGPLPSLPEE